MSDATPRWQVFFDAHRHDLARGVEWLLIGRLLLVVGCIALVLLFDQGYPKNFPAYVILLVAACFAAGYLLAFQKRWVDDLELFVQFQIVLDVALESLLVYATGGVYYDVGFGFLYFASILSASLLISERAGVVLASTATVALCLVALVYAVSADLGVTPPLVNPELLQNVDNRWNAIVTRLLQAAVGFHLVAGLAALLPYRMTRVRILYDEILDSMREGLVAIDNAGKVVFVNREARRLLNWDGIGRLEGRRFTDTLRRREDAKILELLTAEEDIHEEVELELRGRGMTAMDVKTTVLRDGRRRIRGVIGVFADATLQRRVTEMETRLARLEGTEEMALGIAHEIRNPLASIRGAVQELVRTGDARWSDDDRKLASVVQRESDRLDKIVGEFLAFARTRPPERHAHDVGKLVEEAKLLLEQRDDAKSFDILTDMTGGPFVSLVDQGQLRQVLLNVGINGLEAMKKQGIQSSQAAPGRARPRGRLQLIVRPAELPARSELPDGGRLVGARPSVEIVVDDDGPGVPVDQRAKVFMPFFTTKKGGLGLGLALVQKIIRDHGGDVSCDMSASGGARFRIILPLDDQAPRAATGSGLSRMPAAGSSLLRPPVAAAPRGTATASATRVPLPPAGGVA